MRRLLTMLLLASAVLSGHCDGVDGPVVEAARRAIATGDVNAVLPWVPAGQETAVREAFERTASVRKLGPGAAKLADTWFFETVVRIHRAGEGAPYEGLKPAGASVPEAVRAADEAAAAGNVDSLEKALTAGLRERFRRVQELKGYKASDVKAGREYVAAYVEFIHFAERIGGAVKVAGHVH